MTFLGLKQLNESNLMSLPFLLCNAYSRVIMYYSLNDILAKYLSLISLQFHSSIEQIAHSSSIPILGSMRHSVMASSSPPESAVLAYLLANAAILSLVLLSKPQAPIVAL